MRRFLLLLTLSLFCKCIDAQTIYFRHYEIESGLSNNTVITSLQDQEGFCWFGTSDGLNRFDGYTFKTFRMDTSITAGAANNPIFHLYNDKNGTMWVGAAKGLYSFNRKEETFTRLPGTQGKWVRTIQSDGDNNLWFVEGAVLYKYDVTTLKISSYTEPALQNITTLYATADGSLWLGCQNGTLGRYDIRSKTFTFYPSPGAAIDGNTIESICSFTNQALLIGTSRSGLQQFDTGEHNWKPVALSSPNSQQLFIRSILKASQQEYWVGTEAGLFIYNAATGTSRHFHKITGDTYSLSDNAIYSLCKDKEGGIWVGTYFGGINYYPNHSMQFERFFPYPDDSSIQGSVVREIVQDQYGKIWIGTEDKGLTRFDPSTLTFANYNTRTQALPTNIHGLLAEGDQLYVGTFENGLYLLDLPSGRIKQHLTAWRNNGLLSNYINILYKDKAGAIWVCTSNGIYTLNTANKQFTPVAGLPTHYFYSAILQDSSGRMWIGTHDNGIYYIDNGRIKKLTFQQNGLSLLNGNKVVNLMEDRHHHLWICTESGLIKVSLTDYSVTIYNTTSGLPSNIVYSTVEDNHGNIWVTTSMGLAYIDVHSNFFKVFRQNDGLLSNQFNHRSSFTDTAGNIYFGSLKGLIRFNPDKFFVSKHVPTIFFTRLQVYNKEVSANSLYTFSENFNLNTGHITLPWNRSTFNLDFAALGYTSPENTEYAYMLEGIDRQWNFIGKDRRIHFNNLSPGNYAIRIKSTNSNGDWSANERSLGIEVTPPFWRTRLAYLLYSLLIATGCYFLTRYFYRRQKEKQRRRMELFALNKEKELYQHKIDFFTNVAHEIRTPLTLIKAPMDKIFKSVENLPDIKHEITVMNRNTDRLLTLTNQLLDFRKIESGNYFLHTVAMDIVTLAQELHHNFQPKADKKGLQYEMKASQASIICQADEEGMNKIIGNLLDNAIKYGDNYVLMEVIQPDTASGQQLIIKVMNDGDIIPEEERKFIFDAFYRSGHSGLSESTGIGLSLARSLAQLHNGTLVYSTEGVYNVFTFTLPAVKG